MAPSAADKMYLVYRTVREMVADRGYTQLLSGREAVQDRSQFVTEVLSNGTLEKDDLMFSCCNPSNRAKLLVVFAKEDSIGIKPIVALMEKMTADKLKHCLLIYPKTVTAPAKKHIVKARQWIELFAEDELVLNITKHRLMPTHTLLTAEEKTQFLLQSNVKETQLPRILPTDPMAKYLGTRRGDVIRIVRRSETAGKCIMYRLCS